MVKSAKPLAADDVSGCVIFQQSKFTSYFEITHNCIGLYFTLLSVCLFRVQSFPPSFLSS